MANIPIKKLRNFEQSSKQIVTTTDGTDEAFYPLSVLQSVLTNQTYTVKNIFCGSYEKGTIINQKTSLHEILIKLLEESSSNVLTTTTIDHTDWPTTLLDTRVPSTKFLKQQVDTLNTRIDNNIKSYQAGTGLTLVTTAGNNIFNHTNTISESSNENKLRKIRFNSTGHIVASENINTDGINELSSSAQLSDVINAYNTLINRLGVKSST